MKTVRYDSRIYPVEIIEKAIYDYSSLCEIQKIEEQDQIILSFDNTKYNEEITVKEFNNYLLDLIGINNRNG